MRHRHLLLHTARGCAPWPAASSSELGDCPSSDCPRGWCWGRCPMQMSGCGERRSLGPRKHGEAQYKKSTEDISPAQLLKLQRRECARRHWRHQEPPPPRPPQRGRGRGAGKGRERSGRGGGLRGEVAGRSRERTRSSCEVCPPRGSTLACAPRRGGRLQD